MGRYITVDDWATSIKVNDRGSSFIDNAQWYLFASQSIFNPRQLKRNQLLRKRWHRPDGKSNAEYIGLLILGMGADLHATDLRNKIYGLWGLTTIRLIPDYSKSVRNVYIEAALEYLRLYGLTRTLNLAGTRRENKFSLPSWVPDWNNARRSLNIRTYFVDYVGSNPDFIAFGVDSFRPDILIVTGVQLCGVQKIEPELQDDLPPSLFASTWRLCRDVLDRHGNSPHPNGIPPLQAILRLLLNEEDTNGGSGRLEIPSEAFFRLGAAFVGVLCSLDAGDKTKMELQEKIEKRLPPLRLEVGKGFAKTFSEQFLGPGFPPGPWKDAKEALTQPCLLPGSGQGYPKNFQSKQSLPYG